MTTNTAVKLNRKIFDQDLYGIEWERFKKKNSLKHRVCEKCGGTDRLQRHHIKPVNKGGKHVVANIQVLCKHCHEQKHPHMRKKKTVNFV